MQTPQLTKVQIQDTPIMSVYINWTDGDTDYSADIPLAWLMTYAGYACVTDKMVNSWGIQQKAIKHLMKYPRPTLAAIRREFPENVSSVVCAADAVIPSIFQHTAA